MSNFLKHPVYIYIYNNESGKTVSKELNENSEHYLIHIFNTKLFG